MVSVHNSSSHAVSGAAHAVYLLKNFWLSWVAFVYVASWFMISHYLFLVEEARLCCNNCNCLIPCSCRISLANQALILWCKSSHEDDPIHQIGKLNTSCWCLYKRLKFAGVQAKVGLQIQPNESLRIILYRTIFAITSIDRLRETSPDFWFRVQGIIYVCCTVCTILGRNNAWAIQRRTSFERPRSWSYTYGYCSRAQVPQ